MDTVANIICYLVADKASEEAIEGVNIPTNGKLFDVAKSVFDNDLGIQPLNVTFTVESSSGQNNEVRTQLINFSSNPSVAGGHALASRLKSVTTKRSRTGLLMLMLAESEGSKSICVARFPAEEGIMASKSGAGLTVEFIDQVFLKDAKAFKSVRYNDVTTSGGCWSGEAIDRQVNDGVRDVSDYWIMEFLKSEYKTKPKAGTRRLATALKKAIDSTDEISVKREILAACILARNLSGKSVTPISFFNKSSMSSEARMTVMRHLPNKSCEKDPFKFDLTEFDKMLPLQAVEFDTGAMLLAPVGKFEDLVMVEDVGNGKTRASTTGEVIGRSIKKAPK